MSTKHFKMLSHLLLTSECNGEDFVLYQPSLHLLWWYRVLHTSTSCRVGLLRQLYHLIVTWHDIHSSTHSFTHLFQSVHLSIEVWYIEHAQCSVQPQTVHIAGSIWYTATSQHCLDTLQQVKRHTQPPPIHDCHSVMILVQTWEQSYHTQGLPSQTWSWERDIVNVTCSGLQGLSWVITKHKVPKCDCGQS